MATVMFGIRYGLYSLEKFYELLTNFFYEVKARGLEDELRKAVREEKIYLGSRMIYVEEDTSIYDILLDIAKDMGIVPAIV